MNKTWGTKEIKQYKLARREELLPILASALNEFHRIDFSNHFWDDLLGSHIHFALSAEDSWNETMTQPTKYPLFIPQNLDFFPNWQYRLKCNLKLMFKLLFRRQLFGKTYQLSLFLSGDFAFNSFIAETFDGKRPVIIKNYSLHRYFLYRKKNVRCRLRELAYKYAQGDIFIYNLIANLPFLAVEYLQYFLNRKDFKELENVKCQLNWAIPYNPGVKLLCSTLRELGAKTYEYQHGGFTGEYEFQPGLESTRKKQDGFVTWGWQIHPKDIPFKALKIKKFIADYALHRKEKRIYDICLILPKVKSWNHIYIMSILDTLNDWVKSSGLGVCIRFKLSKYEKPNIDLSQFSTLQLASSDISIGKQCALSEIVIHLQHPSTNFLECIAVNQPVLSVLTNDQPSEIVKDFYAFYLEQKIFFKDFDDLLRFVKGNDVVKHCDRVYKLDMHQKFKSTFVNTNFEK